MLSVMILTGDLLEIFSKNRAYGSMLLVVQKKILCFNSPVLRRLVYFSIDDLWCLDRHGSQQLKKEVLNLFFLHCTELVHNNTLRGLSKTLFLVFFGRLLLVLMCF